MITLTYALMLSAILLFAQPPQQSVSVGGRVRINGRHAAVPFAGVRLLHLGREVDNQVTTAEGEFRFANVLPGPYMLEVMHPGFQTQSIELTILGTVGPEQLEIDLKEN